MSPSFFLGNQIPSPGGFESVFLRELQLHATLWDTDITPEHTSSEISSNPFLVKVTVPGLSGPISTLRVTCRHTPTSPPILRGAWGQADYLGDAHGLDPIRDLTVSGIPAGPQELADLTARWLHAQITEDIYRDEWNTGDWTRRDTYGPTTPETEPNRKRIQSILERTNGHATGQHLT